MTMQQLQIKVPPLSEFTPVGNGKRVLPYAVRSGDGVYEAPYLQGITCLQQAQEAYPSYRLFVPNSADVHALFKALEPSKRFWTSTGTVVLRKDENGCADKRVTDLDGKRVELRCTSIAEHGVSWKAKSEKEAVIIDPSRLREYTEIDSVKKAGIYRVAGYDEDRGVVTKFNPSNKPVRNYNDAPAWVDPKLLFAPLDRGLWLLDYREGLFNSGFYGDAEFPLWRFPLGSMATAGSKQILYEKLVGLDAKLDGITSQQVGNLPNYVRDLRRELSVLTKELQSE